MPSATYSTRLTANTTQHDQALTKSAQQIYKYQKRVDNTKSTLSKLTKKFGPLAAQIGIAGGAFAVLQKTMTSTEAGTDALARTMDTAKATVNHFFKSISTGSFDGFINGLGDIVKTAKEAYDALDDLGTLKMWKDMRINQLRAQTAEDRVIVNNPNTSDSERKAAQERIELNMEKIQALTGDLIEQTKVAADKVLQKLAGSTLSPYALRNIMEQRENGTLAQYMKEYKSRMSHDETTIQSVGSSNYGYTQQVTTTQTIWNNAYAKEFYEAMQRLYNATDEEINEWVTLQNEISNQRQQTAAEQAKADKLINKGNGGNGGSDGNGGSGGTGKKDAAPVGSLNWYDEKIKELQTALGNALTKAEKDTIDEEIKRLTSERTKKQLELDGFDFDAIPAKIDAIGLAVDQLPTSLPEIDPEPFIDGLDEAIDSIVTLEDELDAMPDIFGSIGDAFTAMEGIFGDEGDKVFSTIGTLISQIGELVPNIFKLVGAQESEALASGLAGAAKVPYPANIAAIASIVAQIMGVIGTISSLPKFAEGGIVGGSSFIGDFNMARVNSGEMILNTRQQRNLFNMLNNPTINANVSDLGNVVFTIHGSDLQGTLSNYNKKRNRVI